MAPKQSLLFLIILLVISTFPGYAQQMSSYESLREAIFSESRLIGRDGPEQIRWLPGGYQFSYRAFNVQEQQYQINVYDVETNTSQVAISSNAFIHPEKRQPIPFSDYHWSSDVRYVLIESNFRPIFRHSGIFDSYLYDVRTQNTIKISTDVGSAMLSPDANYVGFERDYELFVYDIAQQTETQLTSSSSENIRNGRFSWVYEEEFMISKAWRWSPDSRHIAFWQENSSEVPLFALNDFSGLRQEFQYIPYPRVGDPNPEVQIGVINIETEQKIWLPPALEEEHYIPRIYWTSQANTLAVLILNRRQNGLRLFFYDVTNGDFQEIINENNNSWIDVFDFDENVEDFFLFPDHQEYFFMLSDRDGHRHIYKYDYSGNLVNQVTTGSWDVTELLAYDDKEDRLFYLSTQVSPLERHLYQISSDGRYRTQLTRNSGIHSINLSPNASVYIDQYSNPDTPTQVELWEVNGDRLAVLEANYGVSDFLSRTDYSPREFFSFTTNQGITLDGLLIKPPDFNPNQSYPLLLDVYGGPGSQSVQNIFETRGFYQYLAQQGFIIAAVNYRGSGGYGKSFMKQVYGKLGILEAQDFAETAIYLSKRPYIDAQRMGIRGHSYGGYMVALTMSLYPGLFSAGIAAAPVTDWKLYDTIYTERFMGLADDNPSGYTNSSVLSHAHKHEGNLLLVHSAMDENVHLDHTMQLITTLTDAGIDAEIRIYPKGAHAVSYSQTSFLLLMDVYLDFLKRNLLD